MTENDRNLRGNKGEWSEIYVLLKLLEEGRLYAANENFERKEDQYFIIQSIFRGMDDGLRYDIPEKILKPLQDNSNIEIFYNDRKIDELSQVEIGSNADILLSAIKAKSSVFDVPEIGSILKRMKILSVKADRGQKADIFMQLFDIYTGYQQRAGFSIKSEIGSKPTLLNPSGATNFIYNIESRDSYLREMQFDEFKRINQDYEKIRQRITKLTEAGYELTFEMMDSQVFESNLELIDSRMKQIVAEALLYYYRDGISNCREIVEKLCENNTLKFRNCKAYELKFKRFLTAIALGMKPAAAWDGRDEANGGYIIVTKGGDVVAYHIYNRNYFEDYLLNNTRLDTPSTGRYDFGKVFMEGEGKFIRLNLQIRFK